VATLLKFWICSRSLGGIASSNLAASWISRLKSGNACYHLVESFAFQFGIRKFKIKIYINIILLVMYGCETWSLTLREECRLRVFENRVLKRIFGPKREMK